MKLTGGANPDAHTTVTVERVVPAANVAGGLAGIRDLANRTRRGVLETVGRWRLELTPPELQILRRLPDYVDVVRCAGGMSSELEVIARYLGIDEVNVIEESPGPASVAEWRETYYRQHRMIRALFAALDKVAPDAAASAVREEHLQFILDRGPVKVSEIAFLRRPDGGVRAVRLIRADDPLRRKLDFLTYEKESDSLGFVKLAEPFSVTW